jgi:hypothetical protein
MQQAVIVLATAIFLASPASAVEIPRIDIKQHCATVTKNKQDWVPCMARENEAHAWLRRNAMDDRIVRACWKVVRPVGSYVRLRDCVRSRM